MAAGQIAGIVGLDTVTRFQPVSDPTQAVTHLGNSVGVQPNADGLTACPAAVSEASGGNYTLDSLGNAYGIGSLLASGQNGHGETIGLFELASHSSADVATYLSCFGLANPVSTVQVDGGGGPVGGNPTGEADLDIEQAATQAPGASIISYEGPNGTANGAFDTWNAIVSTDAAQVVSTSYGECEPFAHSAGLIPSLTALFEQAAAQGQTVLASAGDSGAEDCYTKNLDTSEQVDYPASDAWVTAVGGTTLTAGSEVAWNFCQDSESTDCADNNQGVAAGGGGMSRYEPRPAYQPNDLGWPTAQACGQDCRQVPDISANAGTAMVFYTGGSWDIGWGTSFAAPLIAGMVADRDDGCTALTGVFTPALYALYDEGAYGSAFSDITSGNNDMTGTNGGAFAATSGYDPATGIGSPLAAGLSCPEVTSVGAGSAGQQVSVSGLGLEHAAITFGTTPAQVISSTATQATVVVPSGSGTVTVRRVERARAGHRDLHLHLRRLFGFAPRLLAGRIGRRHLLVRLGAVLRLDRVAGASTPGGGHNPDRGSRRLLVGGLRRWALLVRGLGLLRLDSAPRPGAGRDARSQEPRRADRRAGSRHRRARVLHGGLGRWRLRIR